MIDHLVYAVPDVAAAAAELTERLGVAPGPGGTHPGWGTRNVLLSLGPRSYLEIVGPAEEPPAPGRTRLFGVGDLESPRLLTWCEAPPDLDACVAGARKSSYDPGDPVAMERRCADGSTLAWRLTPLERLPLDGLAPFLIDWGTAPHPGGRTPEGCKLLELRARHPEPEAVRRAWTAIGIDHPLETASQPGLTAVLATPRGTVELT